MKIYDKIIKKLIIKMIIRSSHLEKLFNKLPNCFRHDKDIINAFMDKYFSYSCLDSNVDDVIKINRCNKQTNCNSLDFIPNCFLNDKKFMIKQIEKNYLAYYLASLNIRNDINIAKKAFTNNNVDGTKIWYSKVGDDIKSNLTFLYGLKGLKEDVMDTIIKYDSFKINYPDSIYDEESLFILYIYYYSKNNYNLIDDIIKEYNLLHKQGIKSNEVIRLLYLKYMNDDDKYSLITNGKYNDNQAIRDVYTKTLKRTNIK